MSQRPRTVPLFLFLSKNLSLLLTAAVSGPAGKSFRSSESVASQDVILLTAKENSDEKMGCCQSSPYEDGGVKAAYHLRTRPSPSAYATPTNAYSRRYAPYELEANAYHAPSVLISSDAPPTSSTSNDNDKLAIRQEQIGSSARLAPPPASHRSTSGSSYQGHAYSTDAGTSSSSLGGGWAGGDSSSTSTSGGCELDFFETHS